MADRLYPQNMFSHPIQTRQQPILSQGPQQPQLDSQQSVPGLPNQTGDRMWQQMQNQQMQNQQLQNQQLQSQFSSQLPSDFPNSQPNQSQVSIPSVPLHYTTLPPPTIPPQSALFLVFNLFPYSSCRHLLAFRVRLDVDLSPWSPTTPLVVLPYIPVASSSPPTYHPLIPSYLVEIPSFSFLLLSKSSFQYSHLFSLTPPPSGTLTCATRCLCHHSE